MTGLRLSHPNAKLIGRIAVPGSKSESNRLLLLKALYAPEMEIKGLSSARDTLILADLLRSYQAEKYLSAADAGTAMRFMTAFLATRSGNWHLDGSDRMRERPIEILVDALSQLGANIRYKGERGYPPLEIDGVRLRGGLLSLDASVSSQYISALMMIGPGLAKGLELKMEGLSVSTSYIYLTANIMRRMGLKAHVLGDEVRIPVCPDDHQAPAQFAVEPDWSAASYWYSMALLAHKAELFLPGFRQFSLQGDALVQQFFAPLGVASHFIGAGYRLRKETPPGKGSDTINLVQNPDLAQTLTVAYAALNKEVRLNGLQTLRIKETDRLLALKTELEKTGARIELGPDHLEIQRGIQDLKGLRFDTYQDHRMAMAFAPLALLAPIEINDPQVVVKSYGTFWNDLERLGFQIQTY